jgi:hypothetical protein
MFDDEWQKAIWVDYSGGQVTGKDIIDRVLSGPLLSPFSDSDRATFVTPAASCRAASGEIAMCGENASLAFDQLEIVPPHELATIFASGR